jgi:hypothetical protein
MYRWMSCWGAYDEKALQPYAGGGRSVNVPIDGIVGCGTKPKPPARPGAYDPGWRSSPTSFHAPAGVF